MIKEEHSANSSAAKQSKDNIEPVKELSEDMELISPGSMLLEARGNLSLSQEDVAKRLNFRPSLVANMEQDVFDPTLPATFNRGYLVSYAKLVSVDVEEILASYDVLGAANAQRSELQSFSKQTVKETEHSRVMWLSYLILIVLVGLTALWWQQDNKQSTSLVIDASVDKPVLNEAPQQIKVISPDKLVESSVIEEKTSENTNSVEQDVVQVIDESANTTVNEAITEPVLETAKQTELVHIPTEEQKPVEDLIVTSAVFTFSGDCWVNIFDATGERIAWGIKKSGYVMTIEGIAPFRITLGKPELASIVFNDQLVDLSSFNRGNIAKFTLPLTP